MTTSIMRNLIGAVAITILTATAASAIPASAYFNFDTCKTYKHTVTVNNMTNKYYDLNLEGVAYHIKPSKGIVHRTSSCSSTSHLPIRIGTSFKERLKVEGTTLVNITDKGINVHTMNF